MGLLLGLLPLLTTAGGLASAGLGIANAVGGAPKAPTFTPPAPTPPSAQTLLQERQAVAQQTPNVVGATSGLASPAYDSLIAQILAGVLGQPGATAAGNFATGTGQTLNQNFAPANSQPTNAVTQGQPIQLSDFINTSTP